MDLSRVFQSLQIDGQVKLTSPKGAVQLQASRSESQLRVQFENASTFRYFLSSLPQGGASTLQQQLQRVQQLPQAVYVYIAGKPILEKPTAGKVKVHYWRAGREWLRWKTGL